MTDLLPLLNTYERAILCALVGAGDTGLSDQQLQDALTMPAGREQRARRALAGMALLRDTGRTRVARSGRREVVWVVRQ